MKKFPFFVAAVGALAVAVFGNFVPALYAAPEKVEEKAHAATTREDWGKLFAGGLFNAKGKKVSLKSVLNRKKYIGIFARGDEGIPDDMIADLMQFYKKNKKHLEIVYVDEPREGVLVMMQGLKMPWLGTEMSNLACKQYFLKHDVEELPDFRIFNINGEEISKSDFEAVFGRGGDIKSTRFSPKNQAPRKIDNILITASLHEEDLQSAIAELNRAARAGDPTGQGVGIFLPGTSYRQWLVSPITLSVTNVPLSEVLERILHPRNYTYDICDGVVIVKEANSLSTGSIRKKMKHLPITLSLTDVNLKEAIEAVNSASCLDDPTGRGVDIVLAEPFSQESENCSPISLSVYQQPLIKVLEQILRPRNYIYDIRDGVVVVYDMQGKNQMKLERFSVTVSLANATLLEAIHELNKVTRSCDPTGRGIDIVLENPYTQKSQNVSPITLSAHNRPLSKVLEDILHPRNYTYRIRDEIIEVYSCEDRNPFLNDSIKQKMNRILVTISLTNATLPETVHALNKVARSCDPTGSGVNLVLDNTFKQRLQEVMPVTLSVRRQPLSNVLDLILRPRNYTYVTTGGVVEIRNDLKENPIQQKMDRLLISVSFSNATLQEAILAVVDSVRTADPAGQGISISVVDGAKLQDTQRSSFSIKKQPVSKVLKLLLQRYNYTYDIRDGIVIVSPKSVIKK